MDPMTVHSSTLKLRTKGEVDIRDLAMAVEEAVEASGVTMGVLRSLTPRVFEGATPGQQSMTPWLQLFC